MSPFLSDFLLEGPWWLAGLSFLYGFTQCGKSRVDNGGLKLRNFGATLMLYSLLLAAIMFVVGLRIQAYGDCTGGLKSAIECENISNDLGRLGMTLGFGNMVIGIFGVPIVLVLAMVLHYGSPPLKPPSDQSRDQRS